MSISENEFCICSHSRFMHERSGSYVTRYKDCLASFMKNNLFRLHFSLYKDKCGMKGYQEKLIWREECYGKNLDHERRFLKFWEEWSKGTKEQRENWGPFDEGFFPEHCVCKEFVPAKYTGNIVLRTERLT